MKMGDVPIMNPAFFRMVGKKWIIILLNSKQENAKKVTNARIMIIVVHFGMLNLIEDMDFKIFN